MLVVDQVSTKIDRHRFNWSFELQQSQWMAVAGASGIGKSTLLNTLLGFQSIESGEISWQSTVLNNLPVKDRPFGCLFQKDNLFEHLSVQVNLALGLQASGRLSTVQQDSLKQAAGRFGIEELLSQKAADLSGGQQQRVALARVFLQNKPVLLLDEPFSSLDPGLRKEGMAWVKELQSIQQTTILMVTHHLDEAIDHVDLVLEGVSSREWKQYPA